MGGETDEEQAEVKAKKKENRRKKKRIRKQEKQRRGLHTLGDLEMFWRGDSYIP